MEQIAMMLGKAAAGLAVAPLLKALKSRTRTLRIAYFGGREARKEGVDIAFRPLRRWLANDDNQALLIERTPESVQNAVVGIAGIIRQSGDAADSAGAQKVLYIILRRLVESYDPAAAIALTAEWNQAVIHAEGDETRRAVNATRLDILNELGRSGMFASNLLRLPPWRRGSARDLERVWPRFGSLIADFVDAEDRQAVLSQWSDSVDTVLLDAPASVLTWFGLLSGDYMLGSVSDQFISEGVRRGAYPAAYWHARAALAVSWFESATPALSDEVLSHPLGRAIQAANAANDGGVLSALADWEVVEEDDRVIRSILTAQAMAQAGDQNAAIASIRETAILHPGSGASIVAVQMLLVRAQEGRTDRAYVDNAEALRLAVKARNALRDWSGDSARAAFLAVAAAARLGDHKRARALTEEQPRGEATRTEARDPRLMREAAIIAAIEMRIDDAKELSATLGDAYVDSCILAAEAQAQQDDPLTRAHYLAAFHAASDDRDRISALHHLAAFPEPLPATADLANRFPEALAEIRTIHEVSSATDRVSALRVRSSGSFVLCVELADHYSAAGQHADAAAVFSQGAQRWSEPHLMRGAAVEYLAHGDYTSAQRAAESALALGGPEWIGEFDTRTVLFESLEGQGLWDDAIHQARALVALDPSDANARWLLVHALVRSGDIEKAWYVLAPNGEPTPPRNTPDARTWINLLARFEQASLFLPRALSELRRWHDDEEAFGVFVAVIYASLRERGLEPSGENLAALHDATDKYGQDFPNSTIFRIIKFEQPEQILELFSHQLLERHQMLTEIREGVQQGRLPVGILADAANTSYTEACLRRAGGLVPAATSDAIDLIGERLADALAGSAVVDTSVVSTMTLLDDSVSEALRGSFISLEMPDSAYHDAITARQSLGLRSTTSLGWDDFAASPRSTTIDSSVADELFARSVAMCDLIAGCRRRPWPTIRHFPDQQGNPVWLKALDLAVEMGLPLWCDDTVLCALATSVGVVSFSTVDLLRTFGHSGSLDRKLVEVAEAALIRNYYVDLGLNASSMRFAAASDGWRPLGAAFNLTRRASWADPQAAIGFLLEACAECVDDSPEHLREWISCAASGLVEIAGRQAEPSSGNLAVLLRVVTSQSWVRPDRLPWVLAGVRQGLIETAIDPFGSWVQGAYRQLCADHGAAAAAQLLMGFTQHTDEPDRLLVGRVILTSP